MFYHFDEFESFEKILMEHLLELSKMLLLFLQYYLVPVNTI